MKIVCFLLCILIVEFDFLIVDKKSGELIGDIGYFFELDDNGNVDFSSGEISVCLF